jgi:hypothetical protein
MGTGSVIHQIATRDMMANIWCADAEISSIGISQISRAHSGPITIPILFLIFSNPLSVFIFSNHKSQTSNLKSQTSNLKEELISSI